MLDSAYRYFPIGTIHTIVVDPGVGSNRFIIALEADDHFFLAPDNGILSLVLEKAIFKRAVTVQNQNFFLEPLSRTFHGRDIFAPIAAYLAMGKDLDALGPSISISDIIRLDVPKPVLKSTGELIGSVIEIDRYGNLITNLSESLIQELLIKSDGTPLTFQIGNHHISGLTPCYADVPPGTMLAIIGSQGTLEISVSFGSAKELLSALIEDDVIILNADLR